MKRGKRSQPATPAPLKFEVVGAPCSIVKNDTLAKFIDEGKHLIAWNETDNNRLIDRYDARNFFDLESLFVYERKKRKTSIASDMDDKALNDERFYDLFHQHEEEYIEESNVDTKNQVVRKPEKDGMFSAVAFKYESKKEEETPKVEATREIPFSPPFPVPPNMQPPEKIHEIIFRTADFAIKQGTNAEFILKLKQSKNPNFAFLDIGNEYHPYYNYLKEKHSSIHEFMELKIPENKQLDALLNESIAESKKSENSIENSNTSPTNTFNDISSTSGESLGIKLVDYESDEEIQQPVIEPPADVKQVMEKLVTFVRRSGKSFESEVRKREAFNPRFQFLNPLHMYHPYYLQLLSGISPKISSPQVTNSVVEDSAKLDSQKKELRLKKAKLMMEMIKEK